MTAIHGSFAALRMTAALEEYMGLCAYVRCPACGEDFVVSPSMLSVEGIQAHCPFCDRYFPPEESPRIVGWNKERAGIGVTGALRDNM